MKKIILFLIVMAAFAMPVSIFSQCRGGGGAVCGPAGMRFLEATPIFWWAGATSPRII